MRATEMGESIARVGIEAFGKHQEFIGVSDLLPIYDKFEDGAEILWQELWPDADNPNDIPLRVFSEADFESEYEDPAERTVYPNRALIRDETTADIADITELTAAAFATLEISNHTEQFIIAALREAGALAVSLVAETDGRVVGHIAFSQVTVSDGTTDWYGLGPVSVLPEYQRQGIGGELIREGISRLKHLGARGCCLVGHPGYYGRFGFRKTAGLVVEGVPAEVFFALSLDGHVPQGVVGFHPAFMADGDTH